MKMQEQDKRIPMIVILSATILAVALSPQVFAKKPGTPGGGGSFETVFYDVSFNDPLGVFWGSEELTGRIEDEDSPRILVNKNYGDRNAEIQPKQLRDDDDFGFDPGSDGGDDFDTAFPNTTYFGTLQVSADGGQVKMGFDARSRSGKKQHYHFTATVAPAPGDWDPLAMASGDTAVLSLGAWEIRGSNGPVSKSAHAWGDFNGFTEVIVKRR